MASLLPTGEEKTMFITQVAGGQKIKKSLKLPRIDSAKGVESVTQSSQSTELLLAGKQMAEVQAQLEQKKIEFNERMGRCNEWADRIAAKQKWLKNEEVTFQTFTKERDAKRVRELRKAQEAQNVRRQKEKEADALREGMAELQAEVASAKQRLEAGLLYQGYLERVVEASTEFSEIADIIKRHETLVATNTDLQDMVQRNNEETETLRVALHQVTKQRQNEVLVQSSVIAELQQRLEKAGLDTAVVEAAKERREDEVKDSLSELGRSRMAALNLYNRCRSTHMSDSRPKQETRDVTLALRYIEERFRDLQSIVNDAQAAGLVGQEKVREAVVDRQASAAVRT